MSCGLPCSHGFSRALTQQVPDSCTTSSPGFPTLGSTASGLSQGSRDGGGCSFWTCRCVSLATRVSQNLSAACPCVSSAGSDGLSCFLPLSCGLLSHSVLWPYSEIPSLAGDPLAFTGRGCESRYSSVRRLRFWRAHGCCIFSFIRIFPSFCSPHRAVTSAASVTSPARNQAAVGRPPWEGERGLGPLALEGGAL